MKSVRKAAEMVDANFLIRTLIRILRDEFPVSSKPNIHQRIFVTVALALREPNTLRPKLQ